jgi:hypothetical protein
MIVINKNQSNTVILELTTFSQLLNPVYLFEFVSGIKPNSITYFTAEDQSGYRCRYNRFEIIEDPVAIPLSGQVSLRSGQYVANIYEATATTLHVSGTTGRILSTVKVVVNGQDNIPNSLK